MCREDKEPLFQWWRDHSDNSTREKMEHLTKEEIADAFSTLPSFGTGGIRMPEGIGPNRINAITIRWAAAALACTLEPKKEVLIGYDTRKHSKEYALETALTLNRFAVPVAVFSTPIPVPLLSFALKKGNYGAGVMITASHNGSTYNGFKAYNTHGVQMIPKETALLEHQLKKIDPFSIQPLSVTESTKKGLLRYTGKEEKQAYLSQLTRSRLTETDLSIVATPLHGAGHELLPAALKRCGYKVTIVSEQAEPNGDFPTIAAPNPEESSVFTLAKDYGKQQNADLLLATDGDADRCGCCIKHNNHYIPLSGNDIAAVLLYYLTEREKNRIPKGSYIVRTAVSGTVAAAIAQNAGLCVRITPTGFKHIGALAADSANGIFFAGYEESGGFLAGNHAADKDGIQTALLLSEAAAHYKKQGKSLLDILEDIAHRFGREYTSTARFSFPGKSGAEQRDACMTYFKNSIFPHIKKTVWGDTLFFDFGNHIKTALRPSGTEPYLKLYRIIQANDKKEAEEKAKIIDDFFIPRIKAY
ncbi:MAG: phospho-sugar mutase [Firmicutes bacterium]|nr:phospho-sugar mutase [Bacillota bacterium]